MSDRIKSATRSARVCKRDLRPLLAIRSCPCSRSAFEREPLHPCRRRPRHGRAHRRRQVRCVSRRRSPLLHRRQRRSLLDEIEEFLTGRHQAPEGDVTLATILFTDIVDSTAQGRSAWAARAWSKLTDEHDDVRSSCRSNATAVREVKTIGDGFLATFNGAPMPCVARRKSSAGRRRLDWMFERGFTPASRGPRRRHRRTCCHDRQARVRHRRTDTGARLRDREGTASVGSGIALSDQGSHILKGVPDEWRLFAVDDATPELG